MCHIPKKGTKHGTRSGVRLNHAPNISRDTAQANVSYSTTPTPRQHTNNTAPTQHQHTACYSYHHQHRMQKNARPVRRGSRKRTALSRLRYPRGRQKKQAHERPPIDTQYKYRTVREGGRSGGGVSDQQAPHNQKQESEGRRGEQRGGRGGGTPAPRTCLVSCMMVSSLRIFPSLTTPSWPWSL